MESVAKILSLTKKLKETCDKHPDVHLEQFKKLTPFCPVCQKEKMIKDERDFDRKITEQNVRNVFLKTSLISNVKDYRKTFDNYIAETNTLEASVGNIAYKSALEYIKYPDKPITTIFSGKPGRGKTHLVMAMGNMINSQSKPPQRVLFVDVNKLYSHIKNSWDNPSESWTQFEAIKKMSRADVLIIDDLGSESNMTGDKKASETMQDILKQVLDSQDRIIFTTNLTKNDLDATYNPKIVSRLFAHSQGRRVDFGEIKDKRYMM